MDLTTGADEARKTEAFRLLDHIAKDAAAAGVSPEKIERSVRTGEAFNAILEEARTWQAQLIVMAVSRRVGLRSPYVGSQTEHVLEFSECPVLVVPGSVATP
ncbi:MAG TPA: universal stress protein [Candidatus Tyrphobacter sp.]